MWAFGVLAMELAFGKPLASLHSGPGVASTGLQPLKVLHLLPLPGLAEVLAECFEWDPLERPCFEQLLELLLGLLAGL